MVTRRLERYVRRRFDEPERALGALREWRISYEPDPPDERLLAAVAFLADGRADQLRRGFELGETDWRDLLVAGRLEHGNWPDVLDRSLGAP